MVIVDYTNGIVLCVMMLFFIVMGVMGFVKKNAWFVMTSAIISLVMLIIHIGLGELIGKQALKFNALIDFITLAINVPLLVIIDEIETRRGVITKVFEHKYKK